MNKKTTFLIAAFALMLTLSAAGQVIYDSITCTNCILDNPTFINFSFNDTNLSDNLKVNKSGDNITGNLFISGGFINITTNKSMLINTTLVSAHLRYNIGTFRTSPLTVFKVGLQHTGGLGNGGGSFLSFYVKENKTKGEGEHELGRINFVWDNVTANNSRFYISAKKCNGIESGTTACSGGNTIMTGYGNSRNIKFSGNMSLENPDTAITNITIYNNGSINSLSFSGTGNAALCVDSTGTLFRSINTTSNYLTC